MAYGSLQQTLWSATLLDALQKNLVYGALANRDYQQDALSANIVAINTLGNVTVRNYTEAITGSGVLVEDVSSTSQSLNLNQKKYIAVKVEDFLRNQSNVALIDSLMGNAAYQLADGIDQFMAALPSSASSGIANVVTGSAGNYGTSVYSQAVTVARQTRFELSGSAPYPSQSFSTIVGKIAEILDTNNVPKIGRWVVMPSWLVAYGAQDAKWNFQPAVLANGLVQGQLISGIQVYQSNNVPTGFESLPIVIAGSPAGWTFAAQLQEMVAYRPEGFFADAIKGLYVYGGLVTRAAAFAFANVRAF